MPNWCNNFVEFFSDGTQEGNICIKDLHDKMTQTLDLMRQISSDNNYLWEVYLAHYGYGIDIDCRQRGYIFYIGELYEDGGGQMKFNIETDDAWSQNIYFWVILLQHFYKNHISFIYQAVEPGMRIYETNDPGLLPRYNVLVSADGVDGLLELDKLWDWSNPLFPRINNSMVDNYAGYWYSFYQYGADKNGNPGPTVVNRYIMPCVSYWNEFEGDEDEVLSNIEEDIITLQPEDNIDNIQTITEKASIVVNEWQYASIDDIVAGEEVYNQFKNKDKENPEPLIKPVYDNFTTFLGGDSNE